MSDLESSLQALPKQLDLAPGYDVERVRRMFPILAQQIYGKPLIYLDSAATSQKPLVVIEAMSRFFLR